MPEGFTPPMAGLTTHREPPMQAGKEAAPPTQVEKEDKPPEKAKTDGSQPYYLSRSLETLNEEHRTTKPAEGRKSTGKAAAARRAAITSRTRKRTKVAGQIAALSNKASRTKGEERKLKTLRRQHKRLKRRISHFAKNDKSLARLRKYAKAAGLGYDGIVRHYGGYQWCGSFVAYGYGLKWGFGASLASVSKAHAMFRYKGGRGEGYVRLPTGEVLTLRDYHKRRGSERSFIYSGKFTKDYLSPGTFLFHRVGRKTTHMSAVKESYSKNGLIVVETVEGNIGAKTTNRIHLRKSQRRDFKRLMKNDSAFKEWFNGIKGTKKVVFDLRAAAKPSRCDFGAYQDGAKYLRGKPGKRAFKRWKRQQRKKKK
jgi:hypothetical protein